MPRKKRPSAGVSRAYDEALGRLIRQRRIALGLSQTQLGERLDLTFQQVQKYEKGVNRLVFGRFMQVCRILDVAPDELCRQVEQKLGGVPPDDGRSEPARDMLNLVQAGQAVDNDTRRRVTSLLRAVAGSDDAEAE
jgi:transcriptional regulator with XRE-family HTH domain